MNEPCGPNDDPDTHELAGELVLHWCLAQVREVAAIFPGGETAFQQGYETACEELEHRFGGARAGAILDDVLKRVLTAAGGSGADQNQHEDYPLTPGWK